MKKYCTKNLILLLLTSSLLNSQEQCLVPVTGSPFTIPGFPRTIAFSPLANGNLFVSYATVNGNSVATYSVNTSTGAITAVPGSPFTVSIPFSVAYSPLIGNNLFAAATSFNTNQVREFMVDTSTGSFSPALGNPFGTGSAPRSIAYSPLVNGNLFAAVANAGSANVTSYIVDTTTGAFTTVGNFGSDPDPRFITFSPDVNGTLFAAVANLSSNTFSVYTVNTTTGSFSPVTGSPFASNSNPNSISFSPFINGQLFAAVANFSGGALDIYSVNPTTGFFTLIDSITPGVGLFSVKYSSLVNGRLYAAVTDAINRLYIYSVDLTTGLFTQITGSPVSVSQFPQGVDFSPLIGTHFFVGTANDTGSSNIFKIVLPPLLSSVSQPNCAQGLITVTGIAEANLSINITADGATVIGSGTSDNSGNFNFSTTTELSAGTHQITASQTGGTCTLVASNSLNITIEPCPTPPIPPVPPIPSNQSDLVQAIRNKYCPLLAALL